MYPDMEAVNMIDESSDKLMSHPWKLQRGESVGGG
jgi:hypothetical protein